MFRKILEENPQVNFVLNFESIKMTCFLSKVLAKNFSNSHSFPEKGLILFSVNINFYYLYIKKLKMSFDHFKNEI